MEIEQNIWGFTPDGQAVVLYTLRSADGAFVRLTNIGATITEIHVPDRSGALADVALGYRSWESYLSEGAAMCKSVGRYANRIAEGRFVLDGKEYRLAQNNPPNHLHGGVQGFGSRIWEARTEENRVVFSLASPDGDQGYPALLNVEASFYWNDEHRLEITYVAASDGATIVNLTSHLYLNLAGHDSGSVLGHRLQLDCSRFLVNDRVQIPTGEIAPVEGTPMDFRSAKEIGRDIGCDFDFMPEVGGYDHCWVADGWRKNILGRVGSLYDAGSGRKVEFYSSQPGVQIYTGNFLQGTPENKSGGRYANHDGVAVECQGFPDAVNRPEFPSQVLREGETYVQKTVYDFSVSE